MRFLFLFILIFLNNSILAAQNYDPAKNLKSELDSLKTKVLNIENRIDSLREAKRPLLETITDIVKRINRLEYSDKIQEGVEARVKLWGGDFKEKPANYSETIRRLDGEEKVTLLGEYDEPYFKVMYDSTVGYIHYRQLETSKYTSMIVSDAQNKEIQKIKSEDPELARLIEKYGKSAALKIKRGTIWRGMTEQMAIDALGRPNDINRSVGSWGVHEQWVYPGTYLYFENGKLDSWQN